LSLSDRLHQVLRIYALGHEWAKSSDWLCVNLGCNRRQLQLARKELEREIPILSDNSGYWICLEPREYAAVIAHEGKLIRAEAERIEDLKKCLHHTWPTFQDRLFEVEAA
jgi:hypothetical protein